MAMIGFEDQFIADDPPYHPAMYDPNIEAAIQLAANISDAVSHVQVQQSSCKELSWQCTKLITTMSTSRASLVKSDNLRTTDEVERVLSRINQRVQEWSQLDFYQSIFRHNNIKDGVDFGFREIARCLRLFSDSVGIEYSCPWDDTEKEDRMALGTMLQRLTKEMTAFRAALQGNRHYVSALMESIQLELRCLDIDVQQSQELRRSLWELHEETNELPPLLDLTGQVGNISEHPVISSHSSDIYSGIWLDKEKVALKRNRAYSGSLLTKRRLLRGIEACRNLRHPHILPLYGVIYISKYITVVSPWMCHGNVNDFLVCHPNENKILLLLQVSDALEYLHEHSMVHGNIRGSSVLISEYKQVKVAYFGLSGAWDEIDGWLSAPTAPSSVRWAARELVRFGESREITTSTASDSWSFGMLCLEFMTRDHPFSNIIRDVKVYSALASGTLPSRPDKWTAPELTDELWKFMSRCWNDDPQARPCMSEAHRFLMQQNVARRLSVPSVNQTSPVARWSSSHVDRRSVDKVGACQTTGAEGNDPTTPAYQHHSWATSSSIYGSNGTYASSMVIAPTDNSRTSSWLSNVTYRPASSSRAHSMYHGDRKTTMSPVSHKQKPYHHHPPTFLPKRDSGGPRGIGPGLRQDGSVMIGGAGMLTKMIPVAPTKLTIQTDPGDQAAPAKADAPNHAWHMWRKERNGDIANVPTSPELSLGLLLSPSSCPTLTVTGTEDELMDAITACGLETDNIPPSLTCRPPLEVQLTASATLTSNTTLGKALIASPEALVAPLPFESGQIDPESSEPETAVIKPTKSRFRMIMHRISKSIPAKPQVTRGIIFGRPLHEVLSFAGETVPIVLPGHRAAWVKIPTLVTRCGFWLKTHGLHEIGIFRRCDHNSKSVKRLRAEFERAPDYGKRLDMTGLYTAGHTAMALLAFLSELPRPIIPLNQYDQMIAILDQPSDKALDRTESALRDMDPSSRELLLYICDLIVTFAKHGPKTSWRPSGPEQHTNMTGLHDLVFTFRRMLLFHPDRDWRQHEERRVQKTLMFIVENLRKLLEDRHIWH